MDPIKVNTEELRRFIELLTLFGKERNYPYIINAAQQIKSDFVDNKEGMVHELIAYSHKIGKAVEFYTPEK
ncbi:MAG: hypothetical protein WC961_07255 [Anaerovoracaceae bacterium]|jgi:hypothetical protein